MSVIPAPGRPRQEDKEFEANLGYSARVCLQNTPLFCRAIFKNERSRVAEHCGKE
jgi:hypothetical protein